LILFLLCSRESSVTLNALAQDHRNDVFSNTMALVCGTLGRILIFYIDVIQFLFFQGFYSRKPDTGIPPSLVLADSIGAIIISIYIFINWIRQANRKLYRFVSLFSNKYIYVEQVKRLSGHTAKPEFLQQITWIAFHHSPLISKIDTVRAFHIGTHFLVEVCYSIVFRILFIFLG